MINLRPYQQTFTADISTALATHRRVVGTMATGSGKGTVAAYMAERAASRGHRVLVLAHRKELIEDLSGRISGHGVRHGLIAAGRSMDLSQAVQVGSVDTVARRLHLIPAPTLIIQDEAHHLIEGNKWGRVIEAWPDAYLVGLTATPQRLSGEGLGEGHGGYFRQLIQGPTAQWLTDEGYLSRARVLAPPGFDLSGIRRFDTATGKARASEVLRSGQSMGDPVGHYRREIAPIHSGTVLGFCVSVSNAEGYAQLYRDAGIPAACLDGNTEPALRRQLIADLGSGVLKALFSCEIISEGTDIPSVSGVQLFRPTDSLTLYLQQVGRGLRVCAGKPYAVVLDHVGNSHRHGLPTDDREWSLEGKVGRQGGQAAPSVRVCPRCFSAMASAKQVCPDCGHEFTPERRELQHVDGELVEVTTKPGAMPSGGYKKGDIVQDTRFDRKTLKVVNVEKGFARVVNVNADMDDPANSGFGLCIHVSQLEFVSRPSNDHKREQATANTLEDLIAIGTRRGMKNPTGWARHVLAARSLRSGKARVRELVA